MADIYDEGDQIRLKTTAAFRDAAGQPHDPTEVTLEVRRPGSAAPDVYRYSAGDLAHDDTGLFHLDIVLDRAGTWRTYWSSTGDPTVAASYSFVARARATA